jgi:hypothetical protein
VKNLRGILIVGGVIVVLVVVFFVFRDRMSGSAAELQVGDCFDVPAESIDINDVQHHPCTEPHSGEVFFLGSDASAPGASYPAQSDFSADLDAQCAPAFASYVGIAADTSTAYDIEMFYPNEDTFSGGTRTLTCYLVAADGSTMTGSAKGTAK